MAVNVKRKWTVDEYLAFERESEIRHEFLDGEVFAMAGAEPAHVDIRTNTQTSLVLQLRGRPCKVNDQDMRVKTASGLYTYPDISVVCGERQFNDDKPRTLLNPMVIVEVLSPSTESYDRGDKFHHYRSIPTFQEYVLISSTRQQIEHWARQADDSWRITVLDSADGALELTSIGCKLTLADVYVDVVFEG
ncbi:MAG: Uma2 family endonuclease [Anaerolineae bacterium]|nr:Uma2 family endonuclease [Anaerolineae bacterium]